LLEKCLENGEPALLVGETGIGKTTACQFLAESMGQRLRILNCNQHTETSDFLGGYRPNRARKSIVSRLRDTMARFDLQISDSEPDSKVIQRIKDFLQSESNVLPDNIRHIVLQDIASFHAPFEWIDGPLIDAMKNGDILLLDELNLAEDAVLERLNRCDLLDQKTEFFILSHTLSN
jgi:midasin